jgi:hypothetical protein
MRHKNEPQQKFKKIGQIGLKSDGSGIFAKSPHLLIWLLEK